MIYDLLFLVLGSLAGAVSGLLPGVHVNVTAAFLAAGGASLAALGVPPLALAVFIVALTVTHTFFDIVPTVFLGVPGDESYALLPAQRLVRRGRGVEAVRHALHGASGSLLAITVLVLALLALAASGHRPLRFLEDSGGPPMGALLAAAALLLVALDPRPGWALVVFATSGLFGLLVFSTGLVPRDGPFNVLFPALAGLFGTSGLVLSLLSADDELPPQHAVDPVPPERTAIGLGTLGGFVSGILPGLGSANVATLFSLRGRDVEGGRYLQTVAAVNLSDHLMGIAALVLVGRSRSGTAAAIEGVMQVSAGEMAVLSACALVAGLVSRAVVLRMLPTLGERVRSVPYRSMTVSVIAFVASAVGLTTGLWGLVILAAGTLLGMVAPLAGARRAQAMGMFLVPVILFYTGWQARAVTWLHLEAVHLPPALPPLSHALGALVVSFAVALAVLAWREGWAARGWSAAATALLIGAALFSLRWQGAHYTFVGQVVRVKDGDTIVVRHDGRDDTLRLSDIDCPESRQAAGSEAAARTRELTLDRDVRVLVSGTDRYRRLIATVYVGERSVNRALVEEGWAWRFDRYSRDPALLALQEAARAAHRGLWAAPSPEPPWVYRAQVRSGR
jgi:putative membrane protein